LKKLTIRATPVVHTGPLSIVGQSCAGSVGAGGGGRSARMQNAQKRVDLRGTSANWSAKISGARFGVRGDQRGAAICHALTVRDEQGPGLIAAEEILVGADEGPAASGSAATDSHRRSLGTAGKCAGRSAAARGVRLWAQFWSHWCTILMSVAVRLLMHPRCRQVTAFVVSDACDVLNEFCGAWRFPGRADRQQGCMRR